LRHYNSLEERLSLLWHNCMFPWLLLMNLHSLVGKVTGYWMDVRSLILEGLRSVS